MPPAFKERQGIHFSLRDDTFFCPLDVVNPVSEKLSTLTQLATHINSPELRVHEIHDVKVVDLNRVDFPLLLRHPFFPLRDFHRSQGLFAYAPTSEPFQKTG